MQQLTVGLFGLAIKTTHKEFALFCSHFLQHRFSFNALRAPRGLVHDEGKRVRLDLRSQIPGSENGDGGSRSCCEEEEERNQHLHDCARCLECVDVAM